MKFLPFAKITILFQSIWHLVWVITLGKSPAQPNLVWIRWAVETTRGATYGYYDFCLFFNRATVHTREPIFAHNSSKEAVWCEEDPFEDENCVILKFWGVYPKNTLIISRNGQLPVINKMSNNSETVRDTRNMSMNQDYETGVALSDAVNKTCAKRSVADKWQWRHFRYAIKPFFLETVYPRWIVTIERYQEVMVAQNPSWKTAWSAP